MVMVAMQDAQDRLPELLDRVAGGEDVVITREGQPAARLSRPLTSLSGEPTTPGRTRAAADEIKELRRGLNVKPDEILDIIRESRSRSCG